MLPQVVERLSGIREPVEPRSASSRHRCRLAPRCLLPCSLWLLASGLTWMVCDLTGWSARPALVAFEHHWELDQLAGSAGSSIADRQPNFHLSFTLNYVAYTPVPSMIYPFINPSNN